MYNIEKYLNPPKKRIYYTDSPVVHDDQTRKPHDVTNGFAVQDDRDDIAESDHYLDINKPTGRRRHQPHYENRYRVDISSFVCITKRKDTIEITGASEELVKEIHENSEILPVNVTITLDEYNSLVG